MIFQEIKNFFSIESHRFGYTVLLCKCTILQSVLTTLPLILCENVAAINLQKFSFFTILSTICKTALIDTMHFAKPAKIVPNSNRTLYLPKVLQITFQMFSRLSAGCVKNFSNSIAVVKECLRKQYETEKVKKELANKFIACMKKSSADDQSSYLTEPKMVEFQAQMCISKWVEALPEHPETNCSKNSFWDQFKPQPIGINSNIAPRPGPAQSVPGHPGPVAGPISGPASTGVANPFHGPPPQPAVQPLVANQTAGGASHSAGPDVALPPSPPPGKAANPPPPPPPGKEAHPPPPPPVAVTGTPPNVTTPHVGTTAHSAGRRRRSIKL